MSSSDLLDRLVERESFGEIVALLEPDELVVAALRLEGLSDSQIGRLLGVTRASVSYRIQAASRRIMEQQPDLAPLLRDRRQPSQRAPCQETPPLEHGWLCRRSDDEADLLPEPSADLTTQEVAQRCHVKPQTVRRWIRAGRFPNVHQVGLRGDYRIPEGDLVELEGEGSG